MARGARAVQKKWEGGRRDGRGKTRRREEKREEGF